MPIPRLPALRGACLILALSVLAGCATGAARRAPVAGSGDANLHAVAWMQTSVEHDQVYRSVFRAASYQLGPALADPHWDALPAGDRDRPASGLPPAVIVDVDETMLDNSRYQARLLRDDTAYAAASWDAWCREQAASALPGAVEFARQAVARGVTVFYVSNRTQDVASETLANLRATGFPTAQGEAVFLGKGFAVEGCTVADRSDKSCRRRLVGRSHRVLLQVGDQLGDFFETRAVTPTERRAAASPWDDWFGERWFMLPNPSYGNWASAPYRNAHDLPIEAQREAIMKSLSY
jgi:5'-nucleotidase (lipoprotein e(P4) family)